MNADQLHLWIKDLIIRMLVWIFLGVVGCAGTVFAFGYWIGTTLEAQASLNQQLVKDMDEQRGTVTKAVEHCTAIYKHCCAPYVAEGRISNEPKGGLNNYEN